MVNVHNKTIEDTVIIDHYLTDVKLNLGYDGATVYRIPANGKKRIRNSIYLRQLEEEKKTQEIHVRSGGETKLVLHHENFEDNKEIFLEMCKGSVTARYSPKTGANFVDRIWGIIRFCGSGFNTKSSVTTGSPV